jgi:hypothetical protein
MVARRSVTDSRNEFDVLAPASVSSAGFAGATLFMGEA